MSSEQSCERASMARGTTPATAPRQPACTAATCPLGECAISTGTQSAVRAAMPRPSTRVTSASPSSSAIDSARSASETARTPVPCTCRCSNKRSIPSPRLAAKRARFSRTATSSSPKWKPRLRLSYGATLTPPKRVENAWRNPCRARSVERKALTLGYLACRRHARLRLARDRRERFVANSANRADRAHMFSTNRVPLGIEDPSGEDSLDFAMRHFGL